MHPNSANPRLLRILGVGFGVAVTVGGTIGTGILRKPGAIAAQLGDPVLIMGLWILVSIYALFGTFCVVELGTSVPKAGAWYVYARRAFGSYAGFVVGINSWLGTCAAIGFCAFTLSEYVSLLINFPEYLQPYLSILILLSFCALHSAGLKMAGRMQNTMSLLKAAGLVLFVMVCFYYGGNVNLDDVGAATQKITSTGGWIAAVVFSLLAVFYAFDGWHTAAYFTEEDKDPVRNLPRSMIGGVSMVIAIYLLCNLAILYVLPMEMLAGSKLAAADAIGMIFGENSGKIITVFLIISILGVLNAQLMFNPRMIYAMSRDGLFIQSATQVNKGGTPIRSLYITALTAILLIFAGRGACEKLSDVATYFFLMSYSSGFASLLMLRWKEPRLLRPWKVPFYPFLPAGMLILSVLFLLLAIFSDLEQGNSSSVYALAFLLLSYPVYYLIKKSNPKEDEAQVPD